MDFSSECVLIAGCGDLGQRVAQRLSAAGARVLALRRHPPAGDRSLSWLQGDLADPSSLRLPSGITRVVFSPAPDARTEASYRAVFLDGLGHLLDALDRAACRRIVFVSSSAVYGEHGDAWVDESTPPDPPGFNGRVLLEAERWLAAHVPEAVTLRLAGIYGPGRLHLIDRLRQGQAKAPREVPHWANRIHVDDAAAAIVHLLMRNEVLPLYLGVDDTPLPLDVLYGFLADRMGVPRPPDGPAPAGVGSKRLSNALLRASGFAPNWPDARAGYAALLRQEST
ncbi:MAG TPA: SDR family oxidoreductase [Dyella sp.]|uniref:SDR family oxidoreductase n=1 Tax=Dyella sp. TaxID=1869338 RepID=UPI002F91C699